MSKITELKKLVDQMMTITSEDEYLDFVGFQSDWDTEITNAISELYKALTSRDEKYYIPPTTDHDEMQMVFPSAYLCEGCLAYLKSQGYKKVLVGNKVDTDDFECEESKYCDDCGDRYDELTEVYY